MTISMFAEQVREQLLERLGEGHLVNVKEVCKNNDVKWMGVVVQTLGRNIAPTIYLDSFYEAYQVGMSMDSILLRILQIYRDESARGEVNLDFFHDFEKVKDRICMRLVSRERNEELLKSVPHISYLDLELCFFYAYNSEELGNGIILLHNTHAAMWGTDAEELYEIALRNTPRLYPEDLNTMEKVIGDLLRARFEEDGEELIPAGEREKFIKDVPMWILSNSEHSFGAAAIMYPGVLKSLGERFGRDFFIIPSSVHEVILLNDCNYSSAEDLKSIIKEVNRTQLEPHEILSDSLYCYLAEEDAVCVV